MKKTLLSLAVLSAISGSACAMDFGQKVEQLAKAQSFDLFGVVSPLDASSSESISAADADADPTRLVTVARGLSVKVISAVPNLAPNVDQMAL